MAKQTINTGATVDDPSAESIRSAFTKVNAMTLELFTEFSLGGRVAIDLDSAPDTIRDAFVTTNTNLNALYMSQSLPGVPVIDVGDAPDDPDAATIYAAFTAVNTAMTALYAEVDPPAETADYYVAPSGSDTNPGTFAQPFRTIAKGASVLTPGALLYVRGGSYNEQLWNAVPSGTSWAAPVRIAAYPGELVWLRPLSTSTEIVVRFYGNSQYIEFDGINMDGSNARYNVFKIEEWTGGQAHHIRVKNATLIGLNNSATQHSQIVLCTGLIASAIGHNEFINCTVQRSVANVTSFRTNGFYLQSPFNLVERSTMQNLNGFGVQIENEYNPTVPHDTTVRYNIIRNFPNGSERGWGVVVAKPVKAYVYGNLVSGIAHVPSGSAGLYVFHGADVEMYSNTVYGCGGHGISLGASGVTGTVVRNNLSYNNSGGNYVNSGSGTVASNNLTSTTNPLFVNAAGGNFHLQASSPAVGAGVAVGLVTSDLDGVTRGTPPDIGAYEYVP